MVTPLNDFKAKANELFSGHDLDQIAFSRSIPAKCSNGNFSISATAKTAQAIAWQMNVATQESKNFALDLEVNSDHQMKKAMTWSLAKNPNANFQLRLTPTLDMKSGKVAFGDESLGATLSGENYHLELSGRFDDFCPLMASQSSEASVNVKASLMPFAKSGDACGLKNLNLGLTGDLSWSKGFQNGQVGFHHYKNGLETAFMSRDLSSMCLGDASMFLQTPNHKYFKSYGLQFAGGADGGLAMAAEATDIKFKLDHKGIFNVVRDLKINRATKVSLAAQTDLSSGLAEGLRFGAKIEME